MLFPIGDDQVKGGYFPLLSYAFIVLNIVAYWQQIQHPQMLVPQWGAVPEEILRGERLLNLFASMFLHGSLMHLVGNMLFLWVFADNIEATIGSLRFLVFYALGGLVAHAAHIYFNSGSAIPTIGASGAIAAVMGAYLIMFPASRVKLWFFFLIFRIPAALFLGVWIILQWMNGRASLDVNAADTGGTAWWAHIGGFAFGLLAGLYYRFSYRAPE